MKKNSIIIFARYPEIGKVKTRLAKSLGENNALSFYKICAEHTFSECLKFSSNTTSINVFYSDKQDENKIIKWIGNEFLLKEQYGKDLGEKMKNAFEDVFRSGSEKVIIIGTDLPEISYQIINEAFSFLDNFDSIIGPTNDGGYYLLGLKTQLDFLFDDIMWSTDEVFEKTLTRLKENNNSIKILKQMVDIDTEDDLSEWLNLNSKNSYLKKEIRRQILFDK